jgi:hypothetical protein
LEALNVSDTPPAVAESYISTLMVDVVNGFVMSMYHISETPDDRTLATDMLNSCWASLLATVSVNEQ